MSDEPLVLVAGESLVDVLVDVDGGLDPRPGGAPANVARGVARLGGRSAFLGAVSDDYFGRRLRRALTEDGVEAWALVATTRPTTLALAELDVDGVSAYRFYLEGTSAAAVAGPDALATLRSAPAALYVGGLALGLEPIGGAVEALVGAVSASTVVVVDPNCRPGALPDPELHRARFDRLLGRSDLVKVSVEDLAVLRPGVAVGQAAAELVARGPSCVVVTAGAEDLLVVTAGGAAPLPVPEVTVRDTVGAGDAFCAGLMRWWTAQGLGREALGTLGDVLPAAAWAARVAGLTCGRAGAQPPRADELEAPWLSRAGGPDR